MAADSIDIRCPSCDTRYELPESFRKSLMGRAVTCANCSKSWVPLAASGLLARLRGPRELPIDLIAYEKSEETLFADAPSAQPGIPVAPPAETAAPPAAKPKPGTDASAPPPAPGRPAPDVLPDGAATVLDLGASMQGDGSALSADPMRDLDVEWVGTEAPYSGKRFKVRKGRTVIGRSTGDMIIAHERVSKKHAQLDVHGPGHYLLMDLASTNGTTVNGRRISTTGLRNGDLVSFGGVTFKFVARTRGSG